MATRFTLVGMLRMPRQVDESDDRRPGRLPPFPMAVSANRSPAPLACKAFRAGGGPDGGSDAQSPDRAKLYFDQVVTRACKHRVGAIHKPILVRARDRELDPTISSEDHCQ